MDQERSAPFWLNLLQHLWLYQRKYIHKFSLKWGIPFRCNPRTNRKLTSPIRHQEFKRANRVQSISRAWIFFHNYVMADNCFDGLAVWRAPGMQETGVRFLIETQNFFCLVKPTITFGTKLWDSFTYCLFGQNHENTLSQKGENVTADSCLDGLAVWVSPRFQETSVRFLIEA